MLVDRQVVTTRPCSSRSRTTKDDKKNSIFIFLAIDIQIIAKLGMSTVNKVTAVRQLVILSDII